MALLAALGHVANFGQFVEIGQGHAHQKEQIRWTRRNYSLDSQALKIDLLGSARDDVRGTYDTYVERLDSLLLLNGLLLPFALNTLQFSNQFVPGLDCLARDDPNSCIEVRHEWIHTLWVYLVGIDLFIPFWSILILLLCKRRLDTWLQKTLDDLQQMRKMIISNDQPDITVWSKETEERLAAEQKKVVACLGSFIVDYQDLFMDLWGEECRPLVNMATKMLWSSATVAIVLTAYMFWIYLMDRPSQGPIFRDNGDANHFLAITVLGLGLPLVYFLYSWGIRKPTPMPVTNRVASYAENLPMRRESRVSVVSADGGSRLSVDGSSPRVVSRPSDPWIHGS